MWFRWYCQLQNDCKNIFSSDVITAKGALAEDLANGEYTYPILIALYARPAISQAVEGALRRSGRSASQFHDSLARATVVLQGPEVRDRCLAELTVLKEQNKEFAPLWGRTEAMVVAGLPSKKSESSSVRGVPSWTFWLKGLYAA
jgi:geranylgeranyldiphosphate transferase